MSKQVFSGSVTGTSVYKSEISRNGADHRRFSWVYTTTGTLTGTLVVEGSNSSDDLLDFDKAGGTDTTDKATWVPVYFTQSSSNSAANTKAINGAATDSLLPVDNQSYKAYRVKYTNATNSGTLAVTVDTRRA